MGLSARAAVNRGLAVPLVGLEKAKINMDNNKNVENIRKFGHSILGKTEKNQVANNSRIRFELEQKMLADNGASQTALDKRKRELLDEQRTNTREMRQRDAGPRIKEMQEFIE